SAFGDIWTIIVAHILFVGLLGNGALYPVLLVYVSRWFDRRRGSALALISSGQYIAGIAWPVLFESAIAAHGWRLTVAGFAVVTLILVPLAAFFLQLAPEPSGVSGQERQGEQRLVLGLPPNLVLAIIAAAGFACCIPMSIPQGHLVAFCSDIGIA